MRRRDVAVWMLVAATTASAQAPAAQNPSPMVERSRRHERLHPSALDSAALVVAWSDGTSMTLRVPPGRARDGLIDVVVHFHGAAWLPVQAIARAHPRAVAVVINAGAGSGVYDRTFADPARFDTLLAAVAREVQAAHGRPVTLGRITLSGFSAGHGAIRAILRTPRHAERIDAVLLLDGMHASYVPERRVLADSGMIDTTALTSLAAFARRAVRGERRMLVTHSEIFPGTFASTTETADWLLATLDLARRPVLRWGPRGMQQTSEVRAGRLLVQGFSGNSAPDHIDHLHAMPELLARLLGR
ncbi:MAG: hypothetical protein MUE41_07995 [Gemmatimonadaceae bacterium]|nr:hypothetical protein [Gemmatimonadaceae bacterium]